MKTENQTQPVEVFAGTTWQASMVKSLLENAGIGAFMKDAIIGTMNPWWTAPGGAGSVAVFVALKDIEDAKIIVREYEQNLS